MLIYLLISVFLSAALAFDCVLGSITYKAEFLDQMIPGVAVKQPLLGY